MLNGVYYIVACVSQHSMTSTCEQHIAKNECPVCGVARTGQVNPRRSLQEHLRRLAKTDAAHSMWVKEHWGTHFRRGGDRTPKHEIDEAHIRECIKTTFGDSWADRVSITA